MFLNRLIGAKELAFAAEYKLGERARHVRAEICLER